MFNIKSLATAALPLVALVLIAYCLLLGLVHLTIGNLLFGFAVLLAGAWIGIGLGRRSDKANRYYDQVRDRTDPYVDRLEAELTQLRAQLKAYGGTSPNGES